jgi:hypothetical protein
MVKSAAIGLMFGKPRSKSSFASTRAGRDVQKTLYFRAFFYLQMGGEPF